MALTRELKKVGSPIHQYFEHCFQNIGSVVKTLNTELSGLTTLLPANQYNYPWAEVGHMTEYLMDLHLGLNYKDLYAMYILKRFNTPTFDGLIAKYPYLRLDNDTHFDQACGILYRLAILEGWARRGSLGDWEEFYKAKVSDVVIDDLKNIYTQSILKNETINQKDALCYYNPDFTLSEFVGGADADLIIKTESGGYLIDLKTTKNPQVIKEMLFQLIAYTFLDEEDKYDINDIGIYLTRQNKVVKVSVEEVIQTSSGFDSVDEAKRAFCFGVRKFYH